MLLLALYNWYSLTYLFPEHENITLLLYGHNCRYANSLWVMWCDGEKVSRITLSRCQHGPWWRWRWRFEVQLATPRPGALGRVSPQQEDVRLEWLEPVHDERCLRGVGRPVINWVVAIVVQQLVQDYLSVSMTLVWRIPRQMNWRRSQRNCGEIQWRSFRYWGRKWRIYMNIRKKQFISYF